MHRPVRLFTLVAALLCSYAALAAVTGKPPLTRLPGWAAPKAYALALRIDPTGAGFSGTSRITVALKKASDHVWLHGKDLKVSRVTVTDAMGHVYDARYVEAAPRAGVVRVDFGRVLEPQDIALTFTFTAPYNPRLEGLYKVRDDGRAYVLTQMAPISARYAFPSFDEPGFKTPFNITLTIPDTDKGFANTRLVKKAEAGDGWKTLTFAPTQPLPTYLVAYAVGPWSVVEGPTIGPDRYRRQPIRVRGIAPAGKAKYMHRVLDQVPSIIDALEDYYAFGYPFGKIDLLAAPDFHFGAMENPGLVVFRQHLLVLEPGATERDYRAGFNDAAHELAHQWTGDTVTGAWWDDVWLSEGFATWMQHKLTAKLQPTWRADLGRVRSAEGAMRQASRPHARRVRHRITGYGDMLSVYGTITYQQGAAVIGMFEHYVGKDAFRRGMRTYVRAHAFGTANAQDLIDAVATAAGKGQRFKLAFKTFLNQPGVPEITTRLDCDGEHPVLHLAQSRYLPLGSTAEHAGLWGIPVCVRDAAGVACQLLDTQRGTMTLAGDQCPSWYMPNADGIGYYRFAMAPADTAALNAHLVRVSDAGKLAYADAIDAAFHGGAIDAHAVLASVPALAASKTTEIALAPLATFRWIWNHQARTPAQRAKLAAIASAAWLPRLQQIGLQRRKGDSPETVDTRTTLMRLLGLMVKLPNVRTALLAQGDAVLAPSADGRLHFDAVDPDMLPLALAAAVQVYGKPVITRLMYQLQAVTQPRERSAILTALGEARGEQAERVRDFALGKHIRSGEMLRLLAVQGATAPERAARWDWFSRHFTQVLAHAGKFGAAYQPRIGSGCSVAEAQRNAAFFEPRLKHLPRAQRALAQTNEATRLCAALKDAQGPDALMR